MSRIVLVCSILILLVTKASSVMNEASSATEASTSTYTGSASADQVFSLLGASSPLVSNQFSGYLDITGTKALHYMYFESERNPSTDSVIFWTNGGPGCSGLLGLYTEFGPWRAGANNTLIRNPFTWVKYANIVFLEQPVGVGFSYSTEPISHTGYNDYEASVDNLLAIKAFFKKFPERAQNVFYLASESYGGHYIPQWTLQVLGDKSARKNFKGYLLGNPYTSYGSGSTAMANTLWGLQLVPKPLWDAFTELQCDSLFSSAYDFMRHSPDCFDVLDALESYIEALNPYALEFPTCVVASSSDNTTTTPAASRQHTSTVDASSSTTVPAALSAQASMLLRLAKRVRMQSKSGAAIANSDQNTDTHSNTNTRLLESDISGAHTLDALRANHYSQFRYQRSTENTHQASTARTAPAKSVHSRRFNEHALLSEESEFRYVPCAQNYLVEYLNNPAVQVALHVSTTPTPSTTTSADMTSNTTTPRRWDFCSDAINQNWAFNDVLADTTQLYRRIYTHPHKPKDFKMLVFSGDIDGVCATVGTQHWIYNVTHSAPRSLFRAWTYTDSVYGEQMGGYITQFADSFTFLTIRYAGHEVPAYQPQKALRMLTSFLDGSLFSTGGGTNSNSAGTSVDGVGSGDSVGVSEGHTVSVVMGVLLSLVAALGLLACFRKQIFSSS